MDMEFCPNKATCTVVGLHLSRELGMCFNKSCYKNCSLQLNHQFLIAYALYGDATIIQESDITHCTLHSLGQAYSVLSSGMF